MSARKVFGKVEFVDSEGVRWRFEMTRLGVTIRRKKTRKAKAKVFAFGDLVEFAKFTHSEAVARARAEAAAATKSADDRQMTLGVEVEEEKPREVQPELAIG